MHAENLYSKVSVVKTIHGFSVLEKKIYPCSFFFGYNFEEALVKLALSFPCTPKSGT